MDAPLAGAARHPAGIAFSIVLLVALIFPSPSRPRAISPAPLADAMSAYSVDDGRNTFPLLLAVARAPPPAATAGPRRRTYRGACPSSGRAGPRRSLIRHSTRDGSGVRCRLLLLLGVVLGGDRPARRSPDSSGAISGATPLPIKVAPHAQVGASVSPTNTKRTRRLEAGLIELGD